MQKTLLALIVALSLALPTFALDLTVTGCTKDHKQATLIVNLEDGTPDSVLQDIRSVFAKVAGTLTGKELDSTEGYHAFVQALDDVDMGYVDGFAGAPMIGASCSR